MTTAVRVPWKQVVMPDRVARLPQDKRGFPVPWISCWSHEGSRMRPEPMTIHRDGYSVEIMGASCTHVAGQGTPDIANLCAGRQVQGMTQRRCDVCGDPIDGTCHFVGQVRNEWFRETPLHLECAVYSLQVCPGISTGAGVGVQSCEAYDIMPVFLRSDGEGGTEEQQYPDFATAVMAMQITGLPGVLISCHAQPVAPIIALREEFLEAHL